VLFYPSLIGLKVLNGCMLLLSLEDCLPEYKGARLSMRSDGAFVADRFSMLELLSVLIGLLILFSSLSSKFRIVIAGIACLGLSFKSNSSSTRCFVASPKSPSKFGLRPLPIGNGEILWPLTAPLTSPKLYWCEPPLKGD
jgi:hypothetical protein